MLVLGGAFGSTGIIWPTMNDLASGAVKKFSVLMKAHNRTLPLFVARAGMVDVSSADPVDQMLIMPAKRSDVLSSYAIFTNHRHRRLQDGRL